MTVTATVRKAGPFTGNAVQTAFPFAFKIFTKEDIAVIQADLNGAETTLVLDSDYTVALNVDQDNNPGGTVTTTVVPPTNYKLAIIGDLSYTQEMDLTNGGAFLPQVQENAADRTVIEVQQLVEQLSRAVQVPVTSDTNPADLLAELAADAATASAAATAATAAWHAFQGQYYGAYASDPTTDPLGNPPNNGDLYYNTTTGHLRVYDETSTAWIEQPSSALMTPHVFDGDGVTTDFTLTRSPVMAQNALVFVGGVYQRPTLDYTITGTLKLTLSFTSAPAVGTDNVECLVMSVLPISSVDASNVTTAGGNNAQVEMNLKPTKVASVAALNAATTASLPGGFIYLQSYNAGQNQGGGMLVKLASPVTPDNVMTFNDASGASYQRLGVTVLHTLMAGAVPDGVTDNSAAFTRLGNAARAGNFGIHIDGANSPYLVNSGVDWSGIKKITGDGKDRSIITAVGATGSFPNTCVVYSAGPALVALPALSADVSEADLSLALTSAPSMSTGDVGIIYNPTDYSYSSWRNYYRAGEFFEVSSVSGSTVALQSGLYAAYAAAAVNLYKLAANPVSWSGFSIVAPNAGGIAGFILVRGNKVSFSDFRVSNSDYASGLLQQCYDVALSNDVEFLQTVAGAGGYQYGLSIGNCQKVHGIGGVYKGYRHAITTGGGAVTGDVPCRDIWFVGSHGTTVGNVAEIAAFNHHGNTESSGYIDVTANGCFNVAGNKNRYSGTLRIPSAQFGIAVFAAELSGLDHKISGKFYCKGNPATISRSCVDIGGNGVAFGSTVTNGGTLDFSGLSIVAPDATNFVIAAVNRGSPATFSLDLGNVTCDAPLCTGLINAIAASGTQPQIVKAAGAAFVGATLPTSAASLVWATAATKISGLVATGTQVINTTSGNSNASQAITFPRKFVRAPVVTVSPNNAVAGSDKCLVSSGAASQTGTTLTVAPITATFASTSSLTVNWVAQINDAI